MKYNLDHTQTQELENLLTQLPEKSEDIVNKYFQESAARNTMQRIIGMLPVSSREKTHAKNSNPFKNRLINLGFEVITRGGAANKPGSFGYLVFPNEGIGKRNKIAQMFMEEGMDVESTYIVDDLTDLLTQQLMS